MRLELAEREAGWLRSTQRCVKSQGLSRTYDGCFEKIKQDWLFDDDGTAEREGGFQVLGENSTEQKVLELHVDDLTVRVLPERRMKRVRNVIGM